MRICIYAASGEHLDAAYFSAARQLGEAMAKAGHSLVFGGGRRGLMGACAEGVHAFNGHITGVVPRFFDEPGVICDYCDQLIFTETMRERKAVMEDLAEAFLILPGGIGTFEEFFETLTLKQLGRHQKPMALLNTLNYYRPLQAVLEQAAEAGFLGRSCLSLYALFNEPEEALRYLERGDRGDRKGQDLGAYNR